jgi:DNA invertase Pin-like site-specific DNA recombinase
MIEESERSREMTSKRIAIYARVSTANQDTDAQVAECRAYADRCGYIVTGVYTDTISGTTGKDDRPELSRLLHDAFLKQCDAVVVYSIDRLGRSLKHCLEILESLKTYRCDFISLRQQIDTSSATGQLIFNIFACLANYERTMILERTRLGRERAKAKGVKFGRPSRYSPTVGVAIRELRSRGMSVRDLPPAIRPPVEFSHAER